MTDQEKPARAPVSPRERACRAAAEVVEAVAALGVRVPGSPPESWRTVFGALAEAASRAYDEIQELLDTAFEAPDPTGVGATLWPIAKHSGRYAHLKAPFTVLRVFSTPGGRGQLHFATVSDADGMVATNVVRSHLTAQAPLAGGEG